MKGGKHRIFSCNLPVLPFSLNPEYWLRIGQSQRRYWNWCPTLLLKFINRLSIKLSSDKTGKFFSHTLLQGLDKVGVNPHFLLYCQNFFFFDAKIFLTIDWNDPTHLDPTHQCLALAKLSHNYVDTITHVTEENIVRNAQLYHLIDQDSKNKGKRTRDFRSVKVLSNGT